MLYKSPTPMCYSHRRVAIRCLLSEFRRFRKLMILSSLRIRRDYCTGQFRDGRIRTIDNESSKCWADRETEAFPPCFTNYKISFSACFVNGTLHFRTLIRPSIWGPKRIREYSFSTIFIFQCYCLLEQRSTPKLKTYWRVFLIISTRDTSFSNKRDK